MGLIHKCSIDHISANGVYKLMFYLTIVNSELKRGSNNMSILVDKHLFTFDITNSYYRGDKVQDKSGFPD